MVRKILHKKQLAKALCEKTGSKDPECMEWILSKLFEIIRDALLDGWAIYIPCVGRIQPVKTAATTWRNPKTLIAHKLPDRFKVRFVGCRPFERLLTEKILGIKYPCSDERVAKLPSGLGDIL